MGILSKRLLSVGLFTLAASALLVSTASARSSSALRMQDTEDAAGEFDFDTPSRLVEPPERVPLFDNWGKKVENKVHDAIEDLKHKVKEAKHALEDAKHALEDARHAVEDATSESGEYFKVLKHDSFPGIQMRLRKPKLCDPHVTQYSGYLDVSPTKHFFFWFFESRNQPKTDPLVMWLNGGPGCSSFLGLLMELGPCQVNDQGDDTIFNPHSWNSNASVLFLDQPANVGFSYGDTVSSSYAAAQDVYALLQIFFAEFPKYHRLDFHLAGESYGGHYVPAIGHMIHTMNKYVYPSMSPLPSSSSSSSGPRGPGHLLHINLESLLIGNGLTDARLQYPLYPEMAINNTYAPIVTESEYEEMKRHLPACIAMIERCYATESPLLCVPAELYCGNVVAPAYNTGVNPYDVRLKCEVEGLCYPIINSIKTYLNRPDVQHQLGVDAEKSVYESCDSGVGRRFALTGDVMKPAQRFLIPLLDDGIRVLLYSGDADFICNWMGNKAWALALPWFGQYKMQDAPDRRWHANGHHAGDIRSAGPMTFLRVFGAGHMVPYDKPAESLDMLNRWLAHRL
ncbi:hypothetical protein DFQ27_004507 [Actinomortierella ambigua]|uniref:Carboxypeptidase n=1 Tax=Actinomortierella ambigua TaxID=1343610 RepID=A0A9P6Q546_9FUNG|nr:hypothetical protein DFQ27_004507 [Actinomortierella ambigua]